MLAVMAAKRGTTSTLKAAAAWSSDTLSPTTMPTSAEIGGGINQNVQPAAQRRGLKLVLVRLQARAQCCIKGWDRVTRNSVHNTLMFCQCIFTSQHVPDCWENRRSI